MKSLKKSLCPLVVVATLAILFIIFAFTWWLCLSVFHLDPTYSKVIVFGLLIVTLNSFVIWMSKLSKKEQEIINISDHAFFGRIQQRRSSWDSSITLPHVANDIAVSSYENNYPTVVQEKTANWINQSIDLISDDIMSVLKNEYPHYSLPENLTIEYKSLLLDAEEYQSFVLTFEVTGVKSLAGFSASYYNGIFDQLEEIH